MRSQPELTSPDIAYLAALAERAFGFARTATSFGYLYPIMLLRQAGDDLLDLARVGLGWACSAGRSAKIPAFSGSYRHR